MSIFKGKEVRLLKARVDNNNRRLTEMECKHIEKAFYDYRQDRKMPWYGGNTICRNCGKMIREFSDETEFLKAKHEIMKDIIERDKKRIAELEKDRGKI